MALRSRFDARLEGRAGEEDALRAGDHEVLRRARIGDLATSLVKKLVWAQASRSICTWKTCVMQRTRRAHAGTLVRFAQHRGFTGWPQLKVGAAEELGLGTEPYGERTSALVGRAKDRTVARELELCEAQRQNLEAARAASPLSLLADETLLFAIRSPSFFPSAAAGMALAEALIELLASRAGKAMVRRIDQAEMQLSESGAYLQAPKRRG